MQEMRRWISAVLNEGKVERVPYRDFVGNEIMLTLVWNPSYPQLQNLIRRSIDGVFRCLLVGDDIVLWDAHYVEHTDVCKLLGVPRPQGRLGFGSFYEVGDNIVFHGGRGGDNPFYAQNPALRRLFDAGVVPKPCSTQESDERRDPAQDTLTESRAIRVPVWSGDTITVLHNPSRAAFEKFAAKHPSLRGLLSDDGRDLYLWNAGVAIHSNIMQELGLPHLNCIAFYDGRWSGPNLDDRETGGYKQAIERLTPYPRPSQAEDDELLRRLFDDPPLNEPDQKPD